MKCAPLTSNATGHCDASRASTKSFGGVHALRGLDLTVPTGQVTGFLGPNGRASPRRSGSCWACCAPTAARAASWAATRGRCRRLHRSIAYVPGDVTLWPNLTGGEAIDILCRLSGAARPDAQAGRCSSGSTSTRRRRPARTPRATGRRSPSSRRWPRRAELLLLDEPTVGPRPAHGGGVHRVDPRGEGRGTLGAAVQPHLRRGREARRPGDDHPRRRDGRVRHHRRSCGTSRARRSPSSSTAAPTASPPCRACTTCGRSTATYVRGRRRRAAGRARRGRRLCARARSWPTRRRSRTCSCATTATSSAALNGSRGR